MNKFPRRLFAAFLTLCLSLPSPVHALRAGLEGTVESELSAGLEERPSKKKPEKKTEPKKESHVAMDVSSTVLRFLSGLVEELKRNSKTDVTEAVHALGREGGVLTLSVEQFARLAGLPNSEQVRKAEEHHSPFSYVLKTTFQRRVITKRDLWHNVQHLRNGWKISGIRIDLGPGIPRKDNPSLVLPSAEPESEPLRSEVLFAKDEAAQGSAPVHAYRSEELAARLDLPEGIWSFPRSATHVTLQEMNGQASDDAAPAKDFPVLPIHLYYLKENDIVQQIADHLRQEEEARQWDDLGVAQKDVELRLAFHPISSRTRDQVLDWPGVVLWPEGKALPFAPTVPVLRFQAGSNFFSLQKVALTALFRNPLAAKTLVHSIRVADLSGAKSPPRPYAAIAFSAAGMEEAASVETTPFEKIQHRANLTFERVYERLEEALQSAEREGSWVPFLLTTRELALASESPDFTLNLEREFQKETPQLLEDPQIARWAQMYFMVFQENLQLLANFGYPNGQKPDAVAKRISDARWFLENVLPVEHQHFMRAKKASLFPSSLTDLQWEQLRQLHRARWNFFAPRGTFPVPSSLIVANGLFHPSSIVSLIVAFKEAEVGPGSHLLDLGSGVADPSLLATHVFGAHSTGIEWSEFLSRLADLWVDSFSQSIPGLRGRITLRQGDFFNETDLRPYTHLYHFGFHGGGPEDHVFWERFSRELLPRVAVGTRLILDLPFPEPEKELPTLFDSPRWQLLKKVGDLYIFERIDLSAGMEETAGAAVEAREKTIFEPKGSESWKARLQKAAKILEGRGWFRADPFAAPFLKAFSELDRHLETPHQTRHANTRSLPSSLRKTLPQRQELRRMFVAALEQLSRPASDNGMGVTRRNADEEGDHVTVEFPLEDHFAQVIFSIRKDPEAPLLSIYFWRKDLSENSYLGSFRIGKDRTGEGFRPPIHLDAVLARGMKKWLGHRRMVRAWSSDGNTTTALAEFSNFLDALGSYLEELPTRAGLEERPGSHYDPRDVAVRLLEAVSRLEDLFEIQDPVSGKVFLSYSRTERLLSSRPSETTLSSGRDPKTNENELVRQTNRMLRQMFRPNAGNDPGIRKVMAHLRQRGVTRIRIGTNPKKGFSFWNSKRVHHAVKMAQASGFSLKIEAVESARQRQTRAGKHLLHAYWAVMLHRVPGISSWAQIQRRYGMAETEIHPTRSPKQEGSRGNQIRVFVDPPLDDRGMVRPGSVPLTEGRGVALEKLWERLAQAKQDSGHPSRSIYFVGWPTFIDTNGNVAFSFGNAKFVTDVPPNRKQRTLLQILVREDDPFKKPQLAVNVATAQVVYPTPSQTRIYLNADTKDGQLAGDPPLFHAMENMSAALVRHPAFQAADSVVLTNASTLNAHGTVAHTTIVLKLVKVRTILPFQEERDTRLVLQFQGKGPNKQLVAGYDSLSHRKVLPRPEGFDRRKEKHREIRQAWSLLKLASNASPLQRLKALERVVQSAPSRVTKRRVADILDQYYQSAFRITPYHLNGHSEFQRTLAQAGRISADAKELLNLALAALRYAEVHDPPKELSTGWTREILRSVHQKTAGLEEDARKFEETYAVRRVDNPTRFVTMIDTLNHVKNRNLNRFVQAVRFFIPRWKEAAAGDFSRFLKPEERPSMLGQMRQVAYGKPVVVRPGGWVLEPTEEAAVDALVTELLGESVIPYKTLYKAFLSGRDLDPSEEERLSKYHSDFIHVTTFLKYRDYAKAVSAFFEQQRSIWKTPEVREKFIPEALAAFLGSYSRLPSEKKPFYLASEAKAMDGLIGFLGRARIIETWPWPKDRAMVLPGFLGLIQSKETPQQAAYNPLDPAPYDRKASFSEGGAFVSGEGRTPFILYSNAVDSADVEGARVVLPQMFPELSGLSFYRLPGGFTTFRYNTEEFLMGNSHLDTVVNFVPAFMTKNGKAKLVVDPLYYREIQDLKEFQRFMEDQGDSFDLVLVEESERSFNPANFALVLRKGESKPVLLLNHAPETIKKMGLKPETYFTLSKENSFQDIAILGGSLGCLCGLDLLSDSAAGLEEDARAVNALRQVPPAVPGSIGDAVLVFTGAEKTGDLIPLAVQQGWTVALLDGGPRAAGVEELLRRLPGSKGHYAIGVSASGELLKNRPRQILIEDNPQGRRKGFRILGLRAEDLPAPVAAGLEAVLAYLDRAVEA